MQKRRNNYWITGAKNSALKARLLITTWNKKLYRIDCVLWYTYHKSNARINKFPTTPRSMCDKANNAAAMMTHRAPTACVNSLVKKPLYIISSTNGPIIPTPRNKSTFCHQVVKGSSDNALTISCSPNSPGICTPYIWMIINKIVLITKYISKAQPTTCNANFHHFQCNCSLKKCTMFFQCAWCAYTRNCKTTSPSNIISWTMNKSVNRCKGAFPSCASIHRYGPLPGCITKKIARWSIA